MKNGVNMNTSLFTLVNISVFMLNVCLGVYLLRQKMFQTCSVLVLTSSVLNPVHEVPALLHCMRLRVAFPFSSMLVTPPTSFPSGHSEVLHHRLPLWFLVAFVEK